MVLVIDPLAFNAFSQPKALISHSLAYVLVACVAALAFLHGHSIFTRSPMHVPVALFAFAYVISTAFALDTRVALFGAPDRFLGIATTLDMILVYAASATLLRTRSDLLWLAATLALTSVVLVTYALAQRLGLDPIPWSSGIVEVRSFATLGNPGALGQYMSSVAVGAGALAALVRSWSPKMAAVTAGIGAAALIGMSLAGARSSVFGLLAGGLVVALAFGLRSRRRERAVLAGVSLAAAAAAVLVVALALGVRVSAGASGLGEAVATVAAGGSVGGRLDIYRVALEEFRDRPIAGVGPDNYVVAYPSYRSAEHAQLHEGELAQSSTHSWVWKTATDAGLLGLGTLLGVLAIAVAIGIRALRRTTPSSAIAVSALAVLTSYLATGLFSIDHIGTAWIPWFALGLLATQRRAAEAPDVPSDPRDRLRRRHQLRTNSGLPTYVIVVVAVAVALGVTLYPAMQASRAAQQARVASRSEESAPLMLSAAERAVRGDPGRAEYWSVLGSAAFVTADFRRSADAFVRASELAPYDVRHLISLARAQFNLGNRGDRSARDASVLTSRRAVALDPFVPDSHFTLALALLGTANPEEAVLETQRGLAIQPEPADRAVFKVLAQAYLQLKRPVEAEEAIRRALPTSAEAAAADRHRAELIFARTLIAQRRTTEALSVIEAVLESNPTNREALDLKENVLGK